ncbi:MAG: ribulose-phosphate 3-epimerase [Ignavibacteriales bacterium]
MKYLAPSILSADLANLSQQIRFVEMGGADIIHCDIMDGNFVPNISFGPVIVEAIRRITKLPIDVHLMIKNPEKYVKDFINAGANYISVHSEEVIHLDRVINLIKENGAFAGLAINPATSFLTIKNILSEIDFVLVMSVNPGFGGQKFIPYTKGKISELNFARKENGLNYLIEVDGGIDKSNILEISNLGCDIFVAGSAIYKSDNITASTLELKNIIKN